MQKVTILVSILLVVTMFSCSSSSRSQDDLLARSALTQEQVARIRDAYHRSACAFALPWTEAYLDADREVRTAVKLGFSELLVVGNTHDGTPIAVKRAPTMAEGYQVLYIAGLTNSLADAQEAWRLYGRIQRQPSPILPVSVSGPFCPQRRPPQTGESETERRSPEPSTVTVLTANPLFAGGSVETRSRQGKSSGTFAALPDDIGYWVARMPSPEGLTTGPFIVTVRDHRGRVISRFRVDRTACLLGQQILHLTVQPDFTPTLRLYGDNTFWLPLGREVY